jgi:hypothetical protein
MAGFKNLNNSHYRPFLPWFFARQFRKNCRDFLGIFLALL